MSYTVPDALLSLLRQVGIQVPLVAVKDPNEWGMPRILTPISSYPLAYVFPGIVELKSCSRGWQRVAAPVKKTKGAPVSSVVSPARGPSLFLRSRRLRPGVPPSLPTFNLQRFGVGRFNLSLVEWASRRRRREGTAPPIPFQFKVQKSNASKSSHQMLVQMRTIIEIENGGTNMDGLIKKIALIPSSSSKNVEPAGMKEEFQIFDLLL
ncbi:hypothetical protein LXL04_006412 [Taraxacum kok-saghyz]